MVQNLFAIQAIYLRQREALVRFLVRRTRDHALAEDLAQETLVRVSRAGAISALRNPTAYLFQIASNLAVDHVRTEGRRKLFRAEIQSMLQLPDEAPTPEQTSIDRSQIRSLIETISGLPERRRKILLMSRLENQPHAVIAAHFGISVRMVEFELKRALTACLTVKEK